MLWQRAESRAGHRFCMHRNLCVVDFPIYIRLQSRQECLYAC